MPIDPSFIEAVRGGIADPVGAETRGVTLADLLTKSQSGQLDLEQKRQQVRLLSDPRYQAVMAQYLSSLFGGGGAPGGAPGAGAPGMDPATIQDLFAANPMAAGGAITSMQGLAEKQAEIEQKRSGAAENLSKVRAANLTEIGQQADMVAADPTDAKYLAFVRNANARGVLDVGAAPPPPLGAPPQDKIAWLSQFSKTTKEQAAQAAYRGTQTNVLPQELALKQRQQAFAEAEKRGGKAYQDPDTREWFVETQDHDAQGLPIPGAFRQTPLKLGAPSPTAGVTMSGPPAAPGGTQFNIQGDVDLDQLQKVIDAAKADRAARNARVAGTAPTAGASAPAPPVAPMPPVAPVAGLRVGPSGGVQTGPSLQEREQTKALATGAGTHLAELATKASAAAQMQAIVVDLHNREAEGMYSGATQGSDYFRKIAGMLQAMGQLSPEAEKKFANTTSWDAEAITLLAQSVKQFSSRPAAAELGYLAPSKPQVPQTAQAREQIYESLYNVAARAIQEAQQADAHLKAGNPSFANFTPKFAGAKLPPAQVSSLPKLTPQDKGMTAYGDDGSKQFWDGGRWVPAPPDAMVAPR